MNPKQINNPKKLTAKDRAKIKTIEYWSNPDNAFIPWQRLCTEVFHYKDSRYLYKLFTIEERREIELTALTERRKNYIRQSAAVDHGLLKKAVSGDAAAVKLWYQKMEGWSEKQLQNFLDQDLWQKLALLFSIVDRAKSTSNDERAEATRKRMIKSLGPEQKV